MTGFRVLLQNGGSKGLGPFYQTAPLEAGRDVLGALAAGKDAEPSG